MMRPSLRRPSGFTVIELFIVGGLTSVMAVLLSSLWAGLGRPTAGLIDRSQVVQERDLAVAALSRDLGGSLVIPDAAGTTKQLKRFTAWQAVDDHELQLTYAAANAPNTVISYFVQSNTLVRCDETATPTSSFVVARNVDSMTVTPVGNDMHTVIVFKFHNTTLTCDLTVKKP